MLEIGAVVAARCQQHHDRVFRARRRHGAQVFDQPLGIVANGRDALPGEGVGKEPHHDLAVLEHIGDARGRAHIVLEHEEVTLSGADQIDASDMGVDVVRRLDPDHLGPEGGIEQNEFGRHKSCLEDLLVVIDVVEEDVDRLDALNAAPLDQIPFGAVEDAGNEVEGDQTFGRAAFSINGEGDAEPAKQLLGGVLLGDERIDREIVEHAGNGGVSVPDLAVRRAHLVEEFTGRLGGRLASLLGTHPLSRLRQARPSWLSKRPLNPSLARSPVTFSGILSPCRPIEQRPCRSRPRRVVLYGEKC